MTAHQTAWPRQWLMTDERIGDALWEAVAQLPDGDSGLVFRYYATPAERRAALAMDVAQVCRDRGIVLAMAGDPELARRTGADLVHNPRQASALPFSLSVHSLEEAIDAGKRGAALAFVSPVYATRSHPDRASLGPDLASRIALATGIPAIALGGLSAEAFAELPGKAFHGWAGIDAWLSAAR